MATIFLIAAFNAFFFSLLVLQKKQKGHHDKVLAFWLILLGIYTGIYGLTFKFLFTDYPYLSVALISLLMLHGPLLYLYIKALSTANNRPDKVDFLHFVPFALFAIYLVIMNILYGQFAGIHLEHGHSIHHQPVIFTIFLIWIALSGPIYFLWSVRLFRKHSSIIRSNFSYNERISIEWLKTLVVIFGIVWTALMGIAATWHILGLFDWQFCTHGIALSISVFIILTGYFGHRQKDIFSQTSSVYSTEIKIQPDKSEDSLLDDSSVKKYATTGLKEEDANEHAELLRIYMQDKKPYLEPDLTLLALSEKLNIPSHHLSQVINEKFNLNFYDFVNQYRVEEAKIRITNPAFAGLSLLGIALDSGFNSKSSFNRLFKKFTGKTPSEYKTSHTDLSEIKKD